MSKNKKLIFFAYQGTRDGKADENVDAIKSAVSNYNSHQSTYDAKIWEDYTKTGLISQEVLQAINSCEVFAIDMTYFNHNVLFELGYAIAKNKSIIVFLNKSIKYAAKKYGESFLKDIKYQSFSNATDIQKALQQRNYNNDWMQQHVKLDTLSVKPKSIFYIESQNPNQASLDLTEYLKMFSEEKKIKIISDNRSEVQYQPLNWYFSNVYQSQISIMHFLGSDIKNYSEVNAFNSFWAGIACGFDRKVLLLAPKAYRAPLDYYDIMIQYNNNIHITDETERWLTKQVAELESVEKHDGQQLSENETQEFELLKLGVGCEIAENEKEQLLDYFVPTFSYDKAKEAKSIIITGRKGSGKSAIYIKLENELASDKMNYLINLKPESDDLLNHVDLSKIYNTASSKRTFFFTVWKCIILSKLIVDIYRKLQATQNLEVATENWEQDILDYYKRNEKMLGLNFLGVISKINEDYLNDAGTPAPKVLEYLYKHFIGPMRNVLKNYIDHMPNRKYCKIIVLADNLDKTWGTDRNLDIQVEMLSTLLEIEEKIKHDLPEIEMNFRSILFLRKDIFDYMCSHVSEPDKLYSLKHEINWEEYPEKLQLLVEDRFRYILNLDENTNIEQEVWGKYFSISKKKGKKAFDIIENIITKRPRDIIYFIGKLFESAVNHSHVKVDESDLSFAIDNYTKFLSINIIAEIRTIYPEVEGILSKLQEYHGQRMEYKTLLRITKNYGYDNKKTECFVEQLFDKGYMMGYDEKTQTPFSDIQKLKEKLNEKRWFGLKKNKVYVIAHAKYYYIKNQQIKSF